VKRVCQQIAKLRSKAEQEFLGRDHVTGIGVTGDRSLVFLLEEESPKATSDIAHWAAEANVQFEFIVVGKFRPALSR